MRLELYHGTDYEIAQAIEREGFIIKKNDEHWLGNGIYFYIDDTLAKWWTTNPTKKHGSVINNPAIIKSALVVPNEHVLDLRKKDDFNKLIVWEAEYRSKFMEYASGDEININKYRCALFDDIFCRRSIDVIICGFDSKEQPYNDNRMVELLNKLKIAYTEVQVCVRIECQKERLTIVEINRAFEAHKYDMGDENGKAI